MVSNSKARESTTLEGMVIQNRTDISLLRALIRDREGFTSTESRSIGLAGGVTQAGIEGFLKTGGDTMIGPIAYFSKLAIRNAEDSSIDISQEKGDNFTSRIILSVGVTPVNLDWIHGAKHAGQQLEIQGIITESFVIRESINRSISAVGDGNTNIITVTADTTDLGTGDYVDIVGAGEFDVSLAKITIVNGNTFTYDLGVIGSTISDNGNFIRGNIRTHFGENITVIDNQLHSLSFDSISNEWVVKGGEGGLGDNLGDHTATQDLVMDGNAIFLDAAETHAIVAQGLDNFYTVPSGGTHKFFVTEFIPSILSFSQTSAVFGVDIDMNTLDITNIDKLIFETNTQFIDSTLGGLDYKVPDGDRHDFYIENVRFFSVHDASIELFTELSMEGNSIFLDIDKDTEINSFTDDSMQFIVGGILNSVMTSNALSMAVPISMTGFKITNLADPTNPQDAATMQYVDDNTGLLPDLSNLTSPTIPPVDLSLNQHELLDVTNITMSGTIAQGNIKEISALTFDPTNNKSIANLSNGLAFAVPADGVFRFLIGASTRMELVDIGSNIIKLDLLGHAITNILSLESATPNRPGSGFIRMAQADQIRMRNVANDDDLIITSGTDSKGNQAILLDVAGGVQFSVSDFDVDVVQGDIINTGDVLPSGTGGEVGDSTNFYNQMHAQFFIPEAATPIAQRHGLSKTGNIPYINFDDNHTDAGFGIFEAGVRHFLFSRTGETPFVNTFAIAGVSALAGEEYKIQMGNTGSNRASISLVEGDTFDLIINRGFSATTPQCTGVQLQSNGLTTLLTNNIETKFFSNVNVNSNNLDGVKFVFADTSALATIGEFQPSNGGFDLILRERISWESDDTTYIQMDTNGIEIISDDSLLLSSNQGTFFTSGGDPGFEFLFQGQFSLQMFSGGTVFSTRNVFLTNGAEYISFLDAAAGSTLDEPLAGHINLFNDSETGVLSVKKSGGAVVSLEGAGSLNTDLSNLTSPTAPTVNLSLNDHDLLDVTNITMTDSTSVITDIGTIVMATAGGVITNIQDLFFEISQQVIASEPSGLLYSVPSEHHHEFSVDNTPVLFIEEVSNVFQLNLNNHGVVGVEKIEINNAGSFAFGSTAIGSASGGMILSVPDSDVFAFFDGGTSVMEFNASTFALITGTTTINSSTINFGVTGSENINFVGNINIAPDYNDGVKQTFNPNGTNAGINIGTHTADPSSPANADIIYNSTSNKFRFRENGAWVELGGGGSTSFIGFSADADLNMNTFDVTSLDRLLFDVTAGSLISSGDTGITANLVDMHFNIPDTKAFLFTIQGLPRFGFDDTMMEIFGVDLVLDSPINGLFMGNGDIHELDGIIFGNNFTLAANNGSTTFEINSLNATDIFILRQAGDVRLSYDNVGKVILSGGTGGTFISVNNGTFDILAAATNTDTEISSQTGTSIVFKENLTEVGRYDGANNKWVFEELLDMQNNKIIDLADPTVDSDGANKKYVDDNAGGSLDGIQDAEQSIDHETDQFDAEMWMANSKQGDLDVVTTAAEYHQLVTNAIHYIPIYIGKRYQIERIGLDIGLPDVDDFSMTIYDSYPNQNYPRTRLANSVNTFITTAGIQSILFNLNVEPGLYWIAVWFDAGNTSTVRFFPSQTANVVNWIPENGDSGPMSAIHGYLETAHTSPTLPSTADDEMDGIYSSEIPAVFVKLVANTS